jgi:uncharacterized membrane protein YbjE (DUF340 family)
MATIIYLVKLFSFLFLGMLLARLLGPNRFVRATSLFQTAVLWTLLFFMGVNTGSIPNITGELASIGLNALLCSLFAVLGTFVAAFLLVLILRFRKGDDEPAVVPVASRKGPNPLRKLWDIFKEPLFLVAIVLAGLLSRLCTPCFDWFDDSLITYLLYGMLTFVGMSLVQQHVDFRAMFSSPVLLLLPVCTILGSWLGALFLPLCTDYGLSHSLGLVSGFGWYSLSGVLISDLGYPVLGSVSFLSNLFRESLTFFLIPLLARLGSRYLFPAVCVAGATSMDVTLPLITNRFGSQAVGAAMFHGVVISLSAPLLIPLFFR